MKRCRLKRCNFQIKNDMSKKTETSDKQQNGNDFIGDVVGSQFTDLREPEPFLITRLPDIPEPYIDTTKPYFNYKKHKQTCDKKRKARKKKKRR